ncbi:facilitated glucose transporter [Gordonia sp. NPDC003424]
MRWADRLLLAFLVLDGFVVGVLSVAFAYLRFGGVVLPVAAVIAGVLNCVFLWLASSFTDGPARYLPLLAWLLALVIGSLPGPGGDVELDPSGALTIPTLLLLVIGAGLPAVLAWTGRLPAPDVS